MTADKGEVGAGPTGTYEIFHDLVTGYSRASGKEEKSRIDEELWRTFGTTGVAFISDMSRFSKGTRARGICHCLGLIYRMRDIVVPLIARGGGNLLKCETDNCYAFFEDVDVAIRTGIEIHKELRLLNATTEADDDLYVSVGMDFGDMLLIPGRDFYGDPVNTASKLAEDLAQRNETLITDRALQRATGAGSALSEWHTTRISGIELRYTNLELESDR